MNLAIVSQAQNFVFGRDMPLVRSLVSATEISRRQWQVNTRNGGQMTLEDRIVRSIRQRKSVVVLRSELAPLGSTAQVDRVAMRADFWANSKR